MLEDCLAPYVKAVNPIHAVCDAVAAVLLALSTERMAEDTARVWLNPYFPPVRRPETDIRQNPINRYEEADRRAVSIFRVCRIFGWLIPVGSWSYMTGMPVLRSMMGNIPAYVSVALFTTGTYLSD